MQAKLPDRAHPKALPNSDVGRLLYESSHFLEREPDGDRGEEGRHRRWRVGFGKATAEALAKRGASVAVLDRPQSKGKEVADAIGGTFLRGRRDRLRRHRAGAAGGGRRTGRPAHRRDHCRRRRRRADHRARTVRTASTSFRQVQSTSTLVGTFNISRLAAWQMSKQRAGRRRGRRARRHHQHRVDRRVRGPDRPGRLHRVQGRHRRHVPDDGA